MPFKLVPPRQGKTPFWYVRGSHRGVSLDRSTKETDRLKAGRWLRAWRDEIDRGEFSRPGEPTFLDAAVAYMAATGQDRFLQPLIDHFGFTPLPRIDQAAIDAAALKLYPAATPATRNRQLYSPVSAVLKSAGADFKLRRPPGWRGRRRIHVMQPDQAFALLRAASLIDEEFGIFLTVLLYTGLRLGELLRMAVDQVDLAGAYALAPRTKNGEPRGVFLPPPAVAALARHPRGMERPGQRVFRFAKSGRLYAMMAKAKLAAGPALAPVTFHTFRHTWATWMRRYGGLDTTGLVATGAWKDRQAAAVYEHVDVSEEARKAMLLPEEKSWRRAGEGGK